MSTYTKKELEYILEFGKAFGNLQAALNLHKPKYANDDDMEHLHNLYRGLFKSIDNVPESMTLSCLDEFTLNTLNTAMIVFNSWRDVSNFRLGFQQLLANHAEEKERKEKEEEELLEHGAEAFEYTIHLGSGSKTGPSTVPVLMWGTSQKDAEERLQKILDVVDKAKGKVKKEQK